MKTKPLSPEKLAVLARFSNGAVLTTRQIAIDMNNGTSQQVVQYRCEALRERGLLNRHAGLYANEYSLTAKGARVAK